jgi:regulatory protein
MPRVESLREHPRTQGRYLVSLSHAGEQTELTVSLESIAELKLKPGRDLTDADLSHLQASAKATACYDKAIATLSARARSTADLRRYLKTKEFTDTEIAPALEKLQALGLLDDLEYARTFARARLTPSRGFGPRRVAAELARKGVARSVVDRVLAESADERELQRQAAAADGETLRSAVQEAAAKKRRALEGLAPEVQRRRMHGFLARRGFSSAEIAEVLRGMRG